MAYLYAGLCTFGFCFLVIFIFWFSYKYPEKFASFMSFLSIFVVIFCVFWSFYQLFN